MNRRTTIERWSRAALNRGTFALLTVAAGFLTAGDVAAQQKARAAGNDSLPVYGDAVRVALFGEKPGVHTLREVAEDGLVLESSDGLRTVPFSELEFLQIGELRSGGAARAARLGFRDAILGAAFGGGFTYLLMSMGMCQSAQDWICITEETRKSSAIEMAGLGAFLFGISGVRRGLQDYRVWTRVDRRKLILMKPSRQGLDLGLSWRP